MRFLFLLLIPLLANAQTDTTDDGWLFCQQGKIRHAERLATNPKARMAYPGDQSIDVTYYGLDLNLTHTPNYLRGVATITLKSTAASVSSFFLDFNSTTAAGGLGLHVDSVKANGQPLAYQHAQNRLTITPTQSLTNSQTLTLTVYYQGIPNSLEQGSFVFGKHEITGDPVIWSLSEPYGSSDWFPCKDTPGDKADSSAVSITAPAQFVSVSNGVLASTTDNTDGTRTYRWKNSYPIAQYLISIAVTNYQRYDTPVTINGQQLPITHYIYPETLPLVQANLALTPTLIQLFTNRFGPYPFWREKYGHAQIGRYTGGMEHQTISSMEDRALTPRVIAHELAHQWFGDKITCRDWQNIWLNEGFASYAEVVYMESASGQTGYQATMNNFMASARAATGSIYVQDISNSNNIFNSNRTYAKGAAVLHMLRGVVGDSTFFRILRSYAATPSLAYSTAITEDFQAVAEQVSGQKLGYFFKQWIYGEGYPVYKATAYIVNTSTTVMVQLQQRNANSTNPASFTMPVQLRIQSTAGDTLVTVFHTQADQTFTLPCRGTVTGVIVDPNNFILKVAENTLLSPITAINEPTSAQFGIYPNPAQETLTIDLSMQRAGPISVTLTTAAGQRVGGLSETNLGIGKHTRTLSLHGLSAGRYVVTVDSVNGRESQVVLIH